MPKFHLSAFVSLRSHTTTCCLRKDSTISFPEILLPGKDSVLNGLSDQFIASRWLQRRNDGFVFAGYLLLGGKPSGNHLGKSLTDSRAAFEERSKILAYGAGKTDHPLVTFFSVVLRSLAGGKVTVLGKHLLIGVPTEGLLKLVVHVEGEKRVALPLTETTTALEVREVLLQYILL